MAWKTLGDALETAIAMGMESGEMGVDAPSQPKFAKSAGAKAPASVTGQRQTTTKVVDYANAGEGSRAMPTVGMCGRMEAGPPQLGGEAATPSMRRHMFTVIEGSRRAPLEGGAMRPAGHARAPRGEASKLIKLVWG